MELSIKDFLPVHTFMKLDEHGKPWLAGCRCSRCGAVFVGERSACAACAARHSIEPTVLSTLGTLYNYTVVHRSFPGVTTPFVAAIVDLRGGGTLKGTLIDVAPNVETLRRDVPVRVVFRDSGQKNKEGQPFICYYFTPDTGDAP